MVFNRLLYYLTSESTVSCISTKRPENEVSEENETVMHRNTDCFMYNSLVYNWTYLPMSTD